MGFIFNEFVYRPIFNLLIFVYNILPWADFGVAIILVTLLIKFLLIPLSRKQIESQKKMQELQPQLKEIQQKYKNDKERQTKETLEFYKKNKANPFSGCLPMILQIIFLIAILRILMAISSSGLNIANDTNLYPFIKNPGQINQFFLGFMDLSKAVDFKALNAGGVAHLILVLLSAGVQYFQSKMMMPKAVSKSQNATEDFSQIMSKQMLYLGPVMTLFIGIKFPAGVVLYWFVSTVFSVVQQYYLTERKAELSKG
jgi:YidC/Oxa1 family membrane protein insertase